MSGIDCETTSVGVHRKENPIIDGSGISWTDEQKTAMERDIFLEGPCYNNNNINNNNSFHEGLTLHINLPGIGNYIRWIGYVFFLT